MATLMGAKSDTSFWGREVPGKWKSPGAALGPLNWSWDAGCQGGALGWSAVCEQQGFLTTACVLVPPQWPLKVTAFLQGPPLGPRLSQEDSLYPWCVLLTLRAFETLFIPGDQGWLRSAEQGRPSGQSLCSKWTAMGNSPVTAGAAVVKERGTWLDQRRHVFPAWPGGSRACPCVYAAPCPRLVLRETCLP